jgi:hypothetical protein
MFEKMLEDVLKGTDWRIGEMLPDEGSQKRVTFVRDDGNGGVLEHEVALNVSRLDPKAGKQREHWIEATRAALAAVPAAESEVAS